MPTYPIYLGDIFNRYLTLVTTESLLSVITTLLTHDYELLQRACQLSQCSVLSCTIFLMILIPRKSYVPYTPAYYERNYSTTQLHYDYMSCDKIIHTVTGRILVLLQSLF
jgi:hypothetical protein